MTSSIGKGARARRALLKAILVGVVSAAFALPTALRFVGTSSDDGVAYLGGLSLPSDWDHSPPSILQVQSDRHRILSIYTSAKTSTIHYLEYDLRSKVPTIARNGDLGPSFHAPLPSPYLNVVDDTRDRLLMLHGSSISTLNLKSLAMEAPFDLSAKLPSFIGWGMTYSRPDDTLYVVGETIGSSQLQNGFLFPGGTRPPIPATLVALSPQDGSVRWSVPLPNCQVLNTFSIGALVARSQIQDAIYVPCARSLAYPNMAGLVRVDFKPRASQSDAALFQQEFFPISGSWTLNGAFRGIAAFDPSTDRFVMMSLSLTTPGGWVFDGRISGWVGFIPTPIPYDAIGVNTGTGHFYANTGNVGTLVSSVRGTPVPQGHVFENVVGGTGNIFIYADSASHRFFTFVPATAKVDSLTYGVFDDRVPDEQALPPADYDQLTANVDESSSTVATFAGGVRGFGARVALVGGGGGAWEGARQLVGGLPILPPWPGSRAAISPGDRTVTMASIPALDLRNAGAAASSQAVSPDSNSDDEIRTRQVQVATACATIQQTLAARGQSGLGTAIAADCAASPASSDPAATGQISALKAACASIAGALKSQKQNDSATTIQTACDSVGVNSGLAAVAGQAGWPWAPLACLDGSGQRIEQQSKTAADQGDASIVCDINATSSDAASASPGMRLKTGLLDLSVGTSSAEAHAIRTPQGVSASIVSRSQGIDISLPGAGSISIGEVTSTARAVAHGRSGTAHESLVRTFERVVVRDAKGAVVRSVKECDAGDPQCSQVLELANSILAPRYRLYVPAATERATAKGAFAGVEKADAEYLNALNTQNDNSRVVPGLEIIGYNDSAEKSRVDLQLAGVQVNSIYYISVEDTPAAVETIVNTIQVPTPVKEIVPGPVVPQVITRVINRRGAAGTVAGTLAVLVRSPKQALHLALIWLLFGSAIAAVVRRGAFRRSLRS